jgi:hypothetical protein
MNKQLNLKTSLVSAAIMTTSALLGIYAGIANANGHHHGSPKLEPFYMTPSAAVQTCLPKAKGRVTIRPYGNAELMHVEVKGLVPDAEYDFFVLQVPELPFGLSWYQGDIETDSHGRGSADFIGRFNEETFIVAPGSDVAPVTHSDLPNPDADTNPATPPVHTYHLGLWFNSPDDALSAGCPGNVTPFNGEHNAGIQVLNTALFPKDQGPLLSVKP